MRKQSNSFKEFKTQEYFKALAESILGVRRAINSNFAKNTFVDELAKWIAKSNASIYEVPDTIFDKFAEKNVSDITAKYFAKVQVEFNKVLTTNFESMIKLALRHQMYDYLYEYGDDDILKYFDSVVITEDTKELSAEFAAPNDDYGQNMQNRARYALTRNAVNNLLNQRTEQTNINDVAKVQERVKIADEVSRNVYMLNKISDSTNSAKAAMMNFLYGSSDEKQNFISSNYLGKRRRILQASYSTESNKQIRKAVALFLADNREYITNIKSQRNKYEYDLNLLKVRIRNIINKDQEGLQGAFKQQSPDLIVKTELSIAYNFGKVAAFGGKADRYKRFRWNVDREYALISRYKRLSNGSKRTDPVPCEDCEIQDGLEYYLFEIIENQRSAGDVINYKKGGATMWRNHNKPSIVFHPNCQCYWSLIEDVDEEDFDPKKPPLNRPPQGGLGTPIKIALAATAFVAGLALLASNKSLGNATAKAIYSTFSAPRLPPPDAANLPRIVESGLDALNFVGAEKNIVNKVAKSVQIINRV
jgi:hypothetical protein